MTQSISPTVERHLAVDLHKHYLVIGGVNARQEVVLSPRRIPLGEWLTWAKTNLKPSDVLVVEATTNTWWFYDQTYQSVGQVLVAGPRKIVQPLVFHDDHMHVRFFAGGGGRTG